MKLERSLMDELRKLFGASKAEPAPARVQRPPAQDWVARNRCW
jgi:hypothetical protein